MYSWIETARCRLPQVARPFAGAGPGHDDEVPSRPQERRPARANTDGGKNRPGNHHIKEPATPFPSEKVLRPSPRGRRFRPGPESLRPASGMTPFFGGLQQADFQGGKGDLERIPETRLRCRYPAVPVLAGQPGDRRKGVEDMPDDNLFRIGRCNKIVAAVPEEEFVDIQTETPPLRCVQRHAGDPGSVGQHLELGFVHGLCCVNGVALNAFPDRLEEHPFLCPIADDGEANNQKMRPFRFCGIRVSA